MDKQRLIDYLDRQTFAYPEMQSESTEDSTVEYKKGFNEGLKFAIAYIGQLDEPEKVAVPEFVAEWIEENKGRHRLLWIAQEIERGLVNLDVDRWAEVNFDLFARAWLDGYTVEEKKYQVRDKYGYLLIKVQGVVEKYNPHKYYGVMEHSTSLTEQEIKDYDERYWTFAEEVTE